MTTTSPTQRELPELDYTQLDRLFDKTKSRVFLGKSAAFLAPLMCSLNFSWTEDIETACTNGINVWWNPRFYLAMLPEVRETILVHEIWHPARLDMLRRGTRDPKIWNYAADISINNGLIREGYSFKGFKPWFNFDYEGWVTEDIYDDLIAKRDELAKQMGNNPMPPAPWSLPWLVNPTTGTADEQDLVEPDETDINGALMHEVLNNVVAAAHSAKISGGNLPGDVEVTLKRFLQPKLPWDVILNRFFTELSGQDYSMARPNRRYQDVYMSSLLEDTNGLAHVLYVQDVSGSITDGDSIRFNSEFKYCKEYFQPEKVTFAQFDTQIQKVDVFLKEDPFEEIKIIGRGGTDLTCVRELIIEMKPTAVVIFSDLCCDPMAPLPADANCPIIWIALNNRQAKVNMGTIVHLRD